ncbi:MAG: molybdate ABC transporter permease subunit [Actinobacteria bacterium]|nr:molybdate ABC transporter permease subunit [Actinomycetota bacterium]
MTTDSPGSTDPAPSVAARPRRVPHRPGALAVVLATIAVASCVLPIVGLAWRAPWASLGSRLGRSDVRGALVLSLISSTAATLVAFTVGLPLAWILARFEFPLRRVVRSVVILPMVLPPVVGGLALLSMFGRSGPVGRVLFDWFGLTIPYTIWAAIMAETFVALPFFVVTVEAGFRGTRRDLEEAAATLGASRSVTFRRVTLPLVRPSLVAGAVLCWARALGEFGATITFAGDSPRTDTMPLRIFLTFQTDPGGAIALALVLVAVSLAVLVALREHWLGGLR